LTPVLPVTFVVDGMTFNYFSAVTVLGTALDITLQELRIESFFPCDQGHGGRLALLPPRKLSGLRYHGGWTSNQARRATTRCALPEPRRYARDSDRARLPALVRR
jgi:hypothetical protein